METELQPDALTVDKFQTIIDAWIAVRDDIDEREDVIKPLQERRRELEGQILQMLEATGLEKFQGKTGGVEKRTVEYVNQPSDEDRTPFLDYLIRQGELGDVVTFHQGRLTSWYKHKKEEIGFAFKPPGLGEMKQRFELRRRKK
jgi:hypothetical protein